jgi:hypothetical protein
VPEWPAARLERAPGEEAEAMKVIRRTIIILLALFCVFYLVTRPTEAANVVGSIGDGIANVVNAVVTFFTALAN